ncbi:hypothetical protein [Paracoccus tegillarcae]|uniref:Succinate dehydrogenase n=1 Tax=Paracoccus tegillarcae TaxID=1529068 RepID=A0A2K9F3K4_9RHOB|nr:hypothetical protein [Paracoccus tegillarcae]AUH34962.1 hypothetical protein CUV01_17675 [Paracoccus tegillarcae]
MRQFRLPIITAVAALAVTACVPITPMPGQAPPPVTAVPAVPAPPAPTGLDAASRAIARTTVNAELKRRYPSLNVAPLTDCIMNNATTAELVDIAQMTNAGVSGAADSVAAIVSRPATTQCIAGAAAAAQNTA